MKAKFEQFMRDNNALDSFIANFYFIANLYEENANASLIEEYYSKRTHYDDWSEVITDAFNWEKTPQGEDYWAMLDTKWLEHIQP